ncbi:hypothetical protein [Priestia koreensis]|uniref:hypothetical protein n=1 Tax=Priestia koreensis TaxID=284581 RepID=UPI003457C816
MIYKTKLIRSSIVGLISFCCFFTFSFSSNAATKEYGPWKITSYTKGKDWDTVMIYPNKGTTVEIKIKQYGVHKGEQANILWRMFEAGTVGPEGWTEKISTDWNGTLTFTGMDPQKDYTIGWIANTNNDMSGQWSVVIDGRVIR